MYSKITTSKQIKNSAQNTCFKTEQAQQVSNKPCKNLYFDVEFLLLMIKEKVLYMENIIYTKNFTSSSVILNCKPHINTHIYPTID